MAGVLVEPATKAVEAVLAVTTDIGSGILSYGSSIMSEGANELNKTADTLNWMAESKSEKASSQGLIRRDYEDYLVNKMNGEGSFSVEGREFDGKVGNRWWEAKSGGYWDLIENNPNLLNKFKSDMGARLTIARENGATYELFTNSPIPESIKNWLDIKGIPYTETIY